MNTDKLDTTIEELINSFEEVEVATIKMNGEDDITQNDYLNILRNSVLNYFFRRLQKLILSMDNKTSDKIKMIEKIHDSFVSQSKEFIVPLIKKIEKDNRNNANFKAIDEKLKKLMYTPDGGINDNDKENLSELIGELIKSLS